ncbi:MAG TPA: hypothetical protein PLG17_06335 [Thermodesulfobacteriota bacterium]|nr:hypothetical protein [Thermodesulfobacteriota bacterium]
MIHSKEIWEIMKSNMTPGKWYELSEIYRMIGRKAKLDDEDYEPQAPSSDIPKWKRNVRNVLQTRKKTGDIEWDGQAKYRL